MFTELPGPVLVGEGIFSDLPCDVHMGGRPTAPGIVLVDDIVMHESPDMIQFDGGGDTVGSGGWRPEKGAAPEVQGRAQGLAGSGGIGGHGFAQVARVQVGHGGVAGQQCADPVADVIKFLFHVQ